MIPGQAVACACSVAGGVAWSLPSRSWIRPARIWRCTAMPTWFGRSLGHAAYSSRRVLPVARARTRSPRPGLRALGSSPAGLLVDALGARPRPRVALEAFASAAEADLGLLAGGVLRCTVPHLVPGNLWMVNEPIAVQMIPTGECNHAAV